MLWEELGQSRDRVLAKISDHVKALNDIYGATVFVNSDGTKIRNIGFMVKRMIVSIVLIENVLGYNLNCCRAFIDAPNLTISINPAC